MAKNHTSKPRSAAKAPAKRGPGRPRKADFSPDGLLPPAFRALSASKNQSEAPPAWMKDNCENVVTSSPRPIDDAFFELLNAIEGMALLTDDEDEALDAVLQPDSTTGEEPGPPLPVSKLAAQIARAARRIESCNAYRRARLARIDLPRC